MNHPSKPRTPARRAAGLVAALATSMLAACGNQAPPGAPQVPSDPGEVAAAPPPPASSFQCGERIVDVEFHPDRARLDLGTQPLELPRLHTTTGTRYGDGATQFWARGEGEARLRIDGVEVGCTAVDERSPWTEARERDIGFRAVGSEPGWLIEVELGEAPALHLVLDYGERRIQTLASEPFEEREGAVTGYRADTGEGQVELRILRERCSDPMSGEVFEARAELVLGGREYAGCGRFLWE